VDFWAWVRSPLPWSKLDYDTRLGGYRIDITDDQLRGAPKFSRSTDWDWNNRTNDQRVYKYYNTNPLGPGLTRGFLLHTDVNPK
jgi:hypothetical protein